MEDQRGVNKSASSTVTVSDDPAAWAQSIPRSRCLSFAAEASGVAGAIRYARVRTQELEVRFRAPSRCDEADPEIAGRNAGDRATGALLR
jgi:hypothetical protein